MKTQSQSQLFEIVIEYDNGDTKTVPIKAASLEVAETRALKFNPSAKGIKRST